jgi:hypothetical protein
VRHLVSAAVAAAALLAGSLIAVPVAHGDSGATWVARRAPLPNAKLFSHPREGLGAVACPTVRCTAVGHYQDDQQRTQAMVDYRSPSGWSATSSPSPAGGTVGRVACASNGECIAPADTGLMVSTGSNMQYVAVQRGVNITTVACARTSCVAVGSQADDHGNWSLVVFTGGGANWTTHAVDLPAHLPAKSEPWVSAMACHPNGGCEGVGYATFKRAGETVDLPLVVKGSGSRWVAIGSPLPSNALGQAYNVQDVLTDVSCPADGPCVAVGTYDDQGDRTLMLVLTGHSASEGPELPGGGAFSKPGQGPQDVVCVEVSACDIIGNYEAGAEQRMFGVGSNGDAFPLPLPGDAATPETDEAVTGLDCATVHDGLTRCAISGVYLDSSGEIESVLLTSDGTTWDGAVPVEAPTPADATYTVLVEDVSCFAHGCVAVGAYGVPLGTRALIDTLTGSPSAAAQWVSGAASIAPQPHAG